jgi:hypothetical protein
MAGHDGYSRSNNAIAAEAEGRFPASKFAKRAARFRMFKGCTAADVRACFTTGEYHHTSKRYNSTLFYDFLELIESSARRRLAEHIAARKELARLLREAKRRGVTAILMPENGREWYPLVALNHDWPEVEVERLRATLEMTKEVK